MIDEQSNAERRMARSSHREHETRAQRDKMTKLQEFLLSISKPKEVDRSGLPSYEEMTGEEKRVIDNLKRAVDEAIAMFAKYEEK